MEKFTLEPLETDAGTFYGIRGPNQFNTVQPSKETAEFVVKACNAHEGLTNKLTDLIQHLGKDWDGDSMVEECKEALAEAGCPFEYDEEDD